MILTLLLSAWAGVPSRVAATLTIGTSVNDIVTTADGAWVGMDDGGGTFYLLDTGTWQSTAVSACDSMQGITVVDGSSDGSATFYVGCGDGTVTQITVAADGTPTATDSAFDLGDGQVYALETDGTNLYGLVDASGTLNVAAVTLASGTAVSGWPITLSATTVADTALIDSTLVIVHSGDDVTELNTSTTLWSMPTQSLGRTLGDVWPYTSTSFYLADEDGSIVRYTAGGGLYPYQIFNDGLGDTVTALAIDPDNTWMMAGTDTSVEIFAFADTPASDVSLSIADAGNIQEFVWIDGYALGGTSTGTVLVLTDRPWVEVQSTSPSMAVQGDTVTLSFTSDQDGDYSLKRGSSAGETLASGTVSADETETISFTVDDAFEEGVNRLWLLVESNSVVGHDVAEVTIDNPPGAVTLGEDGVLFGDEQLTVQFSGIDDADLAYYTIYIDTTKFTASDYPSGGPAFGGDDDIDAPLTISAEPDTFIKTTLYPLTNGVTYYIAVRATDENGNEGPMSDVQSEIPEPTFSASQLAGEEGGYCATTGGAATPLTLLLGLGALIRRRARVAAAAAAMLVLPSLAHAGEDRIANVQLRYGPTTIQDKNLQTVFGDSGHQMLWGEYGYTNNLFEANVGLGFFQEMGWLVTDDGESSGEHDMLTIFPMTATATLRLDVFKEQILVPFGRAGLDYWLWKENWAVPEGSNDTSKISGAKRGWHYAFGGMLLLDPLDRHSAQELQSTTGIDDTYIVGEYRVTTMNHDEGGLDLSMSEFTLGLKFDF